MPESGRTLKAKLSTLLAGVGFWSGLSVLLSLTSLALPWWGADIITNSYSWGVLQGSGQLPVVVFSANDLGQGFLANYSFMTSLVLATSLLAAVGIFVKRWPPLTAALSSSVLTGLFFLADVQYALDGECRALDRPVSCISSLAGMGTTGQGSGDVVIWGFKTGFYAFVASGVLITVALALERKKSRRLS